jgi:DNA-directed RNA polymerase subunit F
MSSHSEDYVSQLKQELARSNAERQALVEEFRKDISDRAFTPEDLKTKFADLLPKAYDRLTFLLENSDSESVQLSAVKYIFDVAMGKVKITGDNDPDGAIKDLLEAIIPKTAKNRSVNKWLHYRRLR